MGWILFIKILPTLNGLNLYHKGIQWMVDFWDDEQMDLFKWDRALEKFLTSQQRRPEIGPNSQVKLLDNGDIY